VVCIDASAAAKSLVTGSREIRSILRAERFLRRSAIHKAISSFLLSYSLAARCALIMLSRGRAVPREIKNDC